MNLFPAVQSRETMPKGAKVNVHQQRTATSPVPDPIRAEGRERFTVERHDDPRAVEHEWRQLEASGIGTVFQRFDWVDAYVRNVLRHEKADPAIVLGRLDGEAAFVLPLAVRRRFGVRRADWIGGQHAGYNFGLWSAQAAELVAMMDRKALHRLLAPALDGTDLAVLRRVPVIHEGTRQPLGGLAANRSDAIGYALDLDEGFEAVLSTRNGGKRRKKVRQKERRMEEIGALECGTLSDPERAHAAIDFFAEHKALRLAEKGAENSFDRPGVMAFLHELVDRSQGAAEPLLEISVLSVDGKTRAVQGSSIHRGRLNVCFSTYSHDDVFPYSPGEVLRFRHIEECCERGLAAYDLGVGYEAYKVSWCDILHDLDDRYLAFSARGVALAESVRLMEMAKNGMRRSPALWNFLKSIRARIAGRA